MQIRCAKDHVACEKTSVIRRYLSNSVASLQGFRGSNTRSSDDFCFLTQLQSFSFPWGACAGASLRGVLNKYNMPRVIEATVFALMQAKLDTVFTLSCVL